MIKFQCEHCQGVVATEYDDEMVLCGHCETACRVPTEFGPGIVIDDFALLQLAGQGGMGDVYLSHQFSLDRTVALKILKQEFAQDVKFMEEFVREARSVASLNHPNIIQAYKVGEDSGYFFFAMEYVEGRTLADIMKDEGVLDQAIGIEVALEMTRALGYAWDQCKLVHRDIKPENIMVTNDGTSKLMDMGLSRKAEDTADDSDTISGTPQYISPEQIVGNEMDIRGDFYSLGATLYHLLTGRFVFEGTLDQMIHKHVSELPVPARKVNPSITKELSKVLSKLLGKLPEDRYQNAKELEKDLLTAQRAMEGGGNTNKKKKLFKVSADGPASTGRNPALKTDRNKAARTGRNRGVTQSISKTGKNRSVSTGRNRGVTQSISKTSKEKGSTGKNRSINTGKHPATVTTTTGNIRKRDRDQRRSQKEEPKKSKTPLIIGGAVAGLILLIIIIVAASGGGDDKGAQTGGEGKKDNSSQSTVKKAERVITPEEQALLDDPSCLKSIKEKVKGFKGLNYKYYEKDFKSVKDISKSTPKSEGDYHTFSLDIKKRNDKFAFIYEGYIKVPKTEKYTFHLGSDDGSRLFIGDKELINHDGNHGFSFKNKTIVMERGLHKFKLEYYQSTSSRALDVAVEYPGFQKTTIPRSWLFRPAQK